MIEYIEAFLDLGLRTQDKQILRSVLSVLHTTELYMKSNEWKIYETLRKKLSTLEKRGNSSPE